MSKGEVVLTKDEILLLVEVVKQKIKTETCKQRKTKLITIAINLIYESMKLGVVYPICSCKHKAV
jgi:hypothetical protein